MSDEPTYEYVKGYGWMPVVEDQGLIFTCYHGKQWRIIKRKPKVGEHWDGTSSPTNTLEQRVALYIRGRHDIAGSFTAWSAYDDLANYQYKHMYTLIPL